MRCDFNHQSLLQAARYLQDGKLVSFPTETVYGLGADATNDRAVASIYNAKGRPSFNPLIAHVPTLEAAQSIGDFSDTALQLAKQFWPGPMTVVVPLRAPSSISRLVTAGLDTIALRVPAPEKVRALLAEAGRPIAAPSANLSGRISPTLATHVEADLGNKITMILDDGPCQSGVESTIIDCSTETLCILRHGPVTQEQMASFFPGISANSTSVTNDTAPSAPGQLTSHYAPSKAVRLEATDKKTDEFMIGFGSYQGDLNLSPSADLVEAAANLFAYLHQADQSSAQMIAIAPIPSSGLGAAINDRLARAAADQRTSHDGEAS